MKYVFIYLNSFDIDPMANSELFFIDNNKEFNNNSSNWNLFIYFSTMTSTIKVAR